jgi:RNA polymerase sigma-70 factor (ECF subfamily)
MSSHAQSRVETGTPQILWSFERELVGQIPTLRAFSRSLCRNRQLAEDIAQEALVRAWRSRASFERGSNLKAWLFTILRNEFYSHCRRANREGVWDEDMAARIEAPADEQQWAVELSDTVLALYRLPATQREALVLIGAAGFSYKEAAQICGTPIGTTKSRVARARTAITEMLENGPLPRDGAYANAN